MVVNGLYRPSVLLTFKWMALEEGDIGLPFFIWFLFCFLRKFNDLGTYLQRLKDEGNPLESICHTSVNDNDSMG